MYNFDADIYNIDAHFTDEATSMVAFSEHTAIKSVVLVGQSNCGKYSILGQIVDKFRRPPGAPKEDHETKKTEFRNVMFRFPIVYTAENTNELSQHIDYFDNCGAIIFVIDSTSEFKSQPAQDIQNIVDSLAVKPTTHVFIHKSDLVPDTNRGNIENIINQVKLIIPGCTIYETSIMDGTALLGFSQIIESLLPHHSELHEAMDTFARSLDLKNAHLIDVQTRTIFLSGGENVGAETYSLVQDGAEMFVGLASMMDGRSAQAATSIELKGEYLCYFWSAFDVVIAGVSTAEAPMATAKNNAVALLHTIRRILKN